MTGPSTDAVRDHYAALARDYAKGANKACERAYRSLVARRTRDAERILELGCGSMPCVTAAAAPVQVGCDASGEMLRAARAAGASLPLTQSDGARLPFGDETFDAVVSINVVEHVADPGAVLWEAYRILRVGGTLIVVTPNGNLEWLLDLLEAWRLKLPEGPHRFLRQAELETAVPKGLEIIEHQPFLAFPAGPPWFVEIVEGFAPYGLFQSLVATRTF